MIVIITLDAIIILYCPLNSQITSKTDPPNSLLYIITFKVQREKDYLFATLKI